MYRGNEGEGSDGERIGVSINRIHNVFDNRREFLP